MTRVALLLSLILCVGGANLATAQVVGATNRFIVDYAGRATQLESAVRQLGGTVDRLHEGAGLATVSGLSDSTAAALARRPGVVSVTRDVIVQWQRPLTGQPNVVASQAVAPTSHDPTSAFFFPVQWNMQIIHAPEAWAAGVEGSPLVRVAVVDSGIDPFHQDLVGLVDWARSVAFTPSVNPAGPPWGDDQFHGTHLAGTIATNGIGTSGVAPHTSLIAVKVLTWFGTGTVADVIAGIVHAADAGADVINLSLGIGVLKREPGTGLLVAALNRTINYASRKGALVVSAAGNVGVDLTHVQDGAAVPCESGTGICISATGPGDGLASYSDYGRAVDLAAPGGDFAVTGMPATSMVLAPCSSLSVVVPCPGGSFYLFIEGTSMATAHVSGAAALLDAQYGGGLSGAQLEAMLEQMADDLGKPGSDALYGRGRLSLGALAGF